MREQRVKNIENEILDASFKYLCKFGLENVSIRELCKDTGISMGSVYYWFDGKDELILDSAEYGFYKIVDELFDYAYKNINNLEHFLDTFLDEVLKRKNEFRFVYQLVNSPQYGDAVRKKAICLNVSYDKYIQSLSELMDVDFDEMKPLVFLFLSSVLDYIVWEDEVNTKLQLEYLYKIITKNKPKKTF